MLTLFSIPNSNILLHILFADCYFSNYSEFIIVFVCILILHVNIIIYTTYDFEKDFVKELNQAFFICYYYVRDYFH